MKTDAEIKGSEHFGLCPECKGSFVLYHVNRVEFMACDKCKVFYCYGSNCFSGWLYEDESIWRKNDKKLKTYRPVQPYYPEPILPKTGPKEVELWYKDLRFKCVCIEGECSWFTEDGKCGFYSILIQINKSLDRFARDFPDETRWELRVLSTDTQTIESDIDF